MQPILTLICLFLFLVSGNLYAEATDRYEELSGEEDDLEFIGKEWQEGKANIPELPDDNAWAAVEMDALPKSQQLYLALDSVSVSKRDWVTRFWLLIRSRGGAYNAMYEAIRCGSDEFKTYAYGRKGRDPEVKLVLSGHAFQEVPGLSHQIRPGWHYDRPIPPFVTNSDEQLYYRLLSLPWPSVPPFAVRQSHRSLCWSFMIDTLCSQRV